MKKHNISIVCDGVTGTIGGSFISTMRFSEILRKRGHKIILITSGRRGTPGVSYYKGFKTYSFFSVLLPKTEGQLYLSFPTVSQIKKILIDEKIDVVHYMTPTISALVAAKAAQSLGIGLVAHNHTQPENLFLEAPKFVPAKSLNRLFYRYMIWVYGQADVTVCPSKFAERALLKRGAKLKTAVISNGVNRKHFRRIDPRAFLKKYQIPAGRKRLVFVGRLHPEKSVDTLILAAPYILKHYPAAQILIVGFGHLQKYLEKLAKDNRVEKNISFCGRVSPAELLMAYSAGDIFVLPSLAELEGMAVLESMCCKNPLLIANSKESASVDFVDGNGFLFAPKDPKDLATKALILLKNEKMRKKMALRSYTNSRSYDILKSVDKLEAIYDSVARRNIRH